MGRNEFSLENVTARKCVTCKKTKSIDLFGYTGRNRDGQRYKRRTCNKCRAAYQKVKRDEYKARHSYKADKYECVSDNHGEYFGAVMNEGTLKATLGEGYLPPGSEWQDNKTGKRYRVVGNEEWWFLETHIGDNNKSKCKAQRKVEIRGDR